MPITAATSDPATTPIHKLPLALDAEFESGTSEEGALAVYIELSANTTNESKWEERTACPVGVLDPDTGVDFDPVGITG